VLTHEPVFAVMADPEAAERLHDRLRAGGRPVEVLAGMAGLERVAALPEVDCVMAAIVGAAGLLPTLAAARAGKRVLLANKEALVMAGPLFMAAVRQAGRGTVADRQRAQRDFSMPAAGIRRRGPGRGGGAPDFVDRLRGAVPRHAAGSVAGRDAGAGVRPPELESWAARSRWIPPP
jgi:hypothetical protein